MQYLGFIYINFFFIFLSEIHIWHGILYFTWESCSHIMLGSLQGQWHVIETKTSLFDSNRSAVWKVPLLQVIDRLGNGVATSLPVFLILESSLESGKVELTSKTKWDSAQWNRKCRNARQHGEKREEGGGY